MCRALDYFGALLDAGRLTLTRGSPFIVPKTLDQWATGLRHSMFSGLQLFLTSLNGLVDTLKVGPLTRWPRVLLFSCLSFVVVQYVHVQCFSLHYYYYIWQVLLIFIQLRMQFARCIYCHHHRHHYQYHHHHHHLSSSSSGLCACACMCVLNFVQRILHSCHAKLVVHMGFNLGLA